MFYQQFAHNAQAGVGAPRELKQELRKRLLLRAVQQLAHVFGNDAVGRQVIDDAQESAALQSGSAGRWHAAALRHAAALARNAFTGTIAESTANSDALSLRSLADPFAARSALRRTRTPMALGARTLASLSSQLRAARRFRLQRGCWRKQSHKQPEVAHATARYRAPLPGARSVTSAG